MNSGSPGGAWLLVSVPPTVFKAYGLGLGEALRLEHKMPIPQFDSLLPLCHHCTTSTRLQLRTFPSHGSCIRKIHLMASHETLRYSCH